MPIKGPEGQEFQDFESCVSAISGEDTTKEEARQICGSFEAKKDMEDKVSFLQKFLNLISKDSETSENDEQEESTEKDTDESEDDEMEKEFEATSEYIEKDDDKQIVYGVVLKADRPDLEKDIFEKEVVEQEAHNFMLKMQNFNLDHQFETNEVSIIENYIAPCDFEVNGCEVKKGDWVMATKIHDDDIWKEVKKGNFNGYSVEGVAHKVPVE